MLPIMCDTRLVDRHLQTKSRSTNQLLGHLSQYKRITWEADPRQHAMFMLYTTYVMASSKNPVEVQVAVGPNKSLGAFAGATIESLPR